MIVEVESKAIKEVFDKIAKTIFIDNIILRLI